MKESTRAQGEDLRFREDVREHLRRRGREAIEATLEEELIAVLGTERYERHRVGARSKSPSESP